MKKPVYEVKYAIDIEIDNLISDKNWNNAFEISDFYLPWDKKHGQETRFKALFDENYIYFIFYSKDSTLIVMNNISEELEIGKEDRIEIFLSGSESLDEYFCIEVDPYGRVLDYKARYYRIFDRKWEANQLIIKSEIIDDGFNIGLAIPLEVLEDQMKINVSKHFFVGLFRADLQNTTNGIKENWISWVNPKTRYPDYHIPQAFGLFLLVK